MISLKKVNWFAFERGSVVEWLERWTCNSEASRSSPALTTSWIYSF